jgi:hypothetical protein
VEWLVLSIIGPVVPRIRLLTLLLVVERPVESEPTPVESPVDREMMPADVALATE